MTTKFGYLLNEMENAAAQKFPAAHGYAKKRQAVLTYVTDLEARVADLASPQVTAPRPDCEHDWLNEEGYCRWCGADMRSGKVLG